MPRRDHPHRELPIEQIRVLSHPVRLCITDSSQRTRTALAAKSLHPDLVAIEGFADLRIAQVAYHVGVMLHARVISEAA